MGRDALPRHWPASVAYLAQPSHSPGITKAQQQSLRAPWPDLVSELPSSLPRGPSPLVRIAAIDSPSHPAKGQFGLLASRQLPPGSLILPYYGVVHSSLPPHASTHGSTHEKSDYDLWLDRDAGLALDAEKAGNEARFINDYRGIAERPNAEFRECWDTRTRERCMAVFVLPAGKNAGKKATSGIAKGEEVLVSYGKGFWGKRRFEQGTAEDCVPGQDDIE
ncbi:hypothetical protein GGR56DRAFT_393242 [Xylariaceae sp. FL0804]|nr:hypothetical protein GGR56DRAFT_393242 [Xylariaceae sp. FL0804]